MQMQIPPNDEHQPHSSSIKKWLVRLFLVLHASLLITIFLLSAALYIAFRSDSLAIVNTYLLQPLGIEYVRAEGSLADGFTLRGVRTDTAEARSLTLRYRLADILKGDHTVEEIRIDGLRIHLDDFREKDDSPWPFPTFVLKKVTLSNLQLIGDYPLELDIEAREGSYDGDVLNFKSLTAALRSRYADAALRGVLRDNAFAGNALLHPNAAALAPYVSAHTDLPRRIALNVFELSDTQTRIRGKVARLLLKHDPTVSAENISLDFDFRYDTPHLDVDATYLLRRGEVTMATTQHLRYAFEGTTTSTFEGILAAPFPLPSDRLSGSFRHDAGGFSATAAIDGTALRIRSTDFERFGWELHGERQNLAFLPTLPELVRAAPLSFDAGGEYRLSTRTIEGNARARHDHLAFEGRFSSDGIRHRLEGSLALPPDAPAWRLWRRKPPEHLDLSLAYEDETVRLQLSGEQLALAATLRGESLAGSGNYAGVYFDLTGSLSPLQSVLEIDALIPSAFATAASLIPITLHKGEYYDAEIRSKTRIILDKTLSIDTDIRVPWYAVVLDSQRAFGGTEGSLFLRYRDGNVTLERYRFEIADHPIATERPSSLRLTPEGELLLEEVWLYDTLRLTGKVSPDLSAALRLASERFRYRGPEGELQAAADITFERDGEGNQHLGGNLTFLEGTITYLPLQQFKVLDSDIVIIQDVRPPGSTKLSMNLRIEAQKPLRLHTKELDLRLRPEVTLWKEPLGPMQLLGMMSVPSGTAQTAGKNFDIHPSEIYFGGDIPLNPYLNLTIGHEVDYKKIVIYVTHTLDSPIFLFTSDPVMSQNDIMSYLLFGSPASTALGGRGGEEAGTSTIRADATNFMLGAGLKGLIGGVTKIQIDTMNILTTAEGGMGFEVGARLNKNLRVLYKNDTLSSILVQYQVNRWLRLDADVHELGQGINAVYIKDFRDFLPHNPPRTR